jgi:hypothetical protein
MADIKYTSIINSFVSQEGMMGSYTNYVYYSILVVYSDGTKSIVEGKRDQIAPFLLFLRTPVDELQDIKQLIQSLPSDMSNISRKIDDNMNYILDSLYPIPDVRGMKLKEATKCLEEHELLPNIVQGEEIPDDKQVVCFLQRNKNNFKQVDIGTTQSVPAVDGLTKDVAVEVLEKAGFQVKVKYLPSEEQEHDIVLGYSRKDDTTQLVELKVGAESQYEGINLNGKKAVYPIPSGEANMVLCPKCKTKQRVNRHLCLKCGIPFMYEE